MQEKKNFTQDYTALPFDYGATAAIENWRDDFRWPHHYNQSFNTVHSMISNIIGFISNIDNNSDRNIIILSLVQTVPKALFYGEVALTLQFEEDTGVRWISSQPELDILRGQSKTINSDTYGIKNFKNHGPVKWGLARKSARVSSWTPSLKFPKALLKPDVTVITHNPLLRQKARLSSLAIGFSHAETIYYLSTKGNVRNKQDYAQNNLFHLAQSLTTAFVNIDILKSDYQERLYNLIFPQILLSIEKANQDLESIKSYRNLPTKLWSGSPGYYPSRAIGIEVRRRGGHLTTFAHGWFSGMSGLVEPFAISELAISNRYIVETPLAAKLFRNVVTRGLPEKFNSIEIEGYRGPSSLSKLKLKINYSSSNKNNRTVYAPTIFRGGRQLFPPLLPDPVYLDWQLRLVKFLQSLPVTLFCRPHPEGLLRNKEHPLSSVSDIAKGSFEDHMSGTDRFIFDYGQSTTFAEALCTEKPIIFLDIGITRFNSKVREMLDRRCSVIKVLFSEKNLPIINNKEITESLLSGPNNVDPTEFRELLMGEGV